MSPRPRTIPRKRPRQDRSKATVDAILTATARILMADGYDRASTNRVALAAGVSVGSLYQYFPSKEALVAALLERHTNDMLAVLGAKIEELVDAPLPIAARELVRAMVCAHRLDPRLHKVLVEQVPRVGRLNRVAEFEVKVAVLLRSYLEQRREQIHPKDLDMAAFVLVRAVESITHAAVLDHPEYLGDDRLADEVTAMVLRYIMKDPPATV